MERTDPVASAVITASAAAGPLFIAWMALLSLIEHFPQPVVITFFEISLFLGLLVPALVVGAILALLPNLIGTALMRLLAEHVEIARAPFVWAAAGAIVGGSIGLLLGWTYTDSTVLALALTGAGCAWICSRAVRVD